MNITIITLEVLYNFEAIETYSEKIYHKNIVFEKNHEPSSLFSPTSLDVSLVQQGVTGTTRCVTGILFTIVFSTQPWYYC